MTLRRTALRSVSKKQANRLKAYSLQRLVFLANKPVCERCSAAASSEVHHKQGRVADLLLDTRHWAALCHACHHEITLNPLQALRDGWSELRLAQDPEDAA